MIYALFALIVALLLLLGRDGWLADKARIKSAGFRGRAELAESRADHREDHIDGLEADLELERSRVVDLDIKAVALSKAIVGRDFEIDGLKADHRKAMALAKGELDGLRADVAGRDAILDEALSGVREAAERLARLESAWPSSLVEKASR